MPFLKTPLAVGGGRLSYVDSEKESIDGFLRLFLNTSKWSVASDPEFGFEFVGLKFEIFDENSGTVFDSARDGINDSLYKKKISGSSKNLDTFASDLNNAIKIYEPRLKDVVTNMTYIRENRIIIIGVKGFMVKTGKPYEYTSILNVWS